MSGNEDSGPEILARDHPLTVKEAKAVQDAQRKLGFSMELTPAQREVFAHRRAASEQYTRQTTTPGKPVTRLPPRISPG